MSPSKRRPTKKKEPASRSTGSSARNSNTTSKTSTAGGGKRNARRAAPVERSGRTARAPSRSGGDRVESFRKLPTSPPRSRSDRSARSERSAGPEQPRVEPFDEALQRLARSLRSL